MCLLWKIKIFMLQTVWVLSLVLCYCFVSFVWNWGFSRFQNTEPKPKCYRIALNSMVNNYTNKAICSTKIGIPIRKGSDEKIMLISIPFRRNVHGRHVSLHRFFRMFWMIVRNGDWLLKTRYMTAKWTPARDEILKSSVLESYSFCFFCLYATSSKRVRYDTLEYHKGDSAYN